MKREAFDPAPAALRLRGAPWRQGAFALGRSANGSCRGRSKAHRNRQPSGEADLTPAFHRRSSRLARGRTRCSSLRRSVDFERSSRLSVWRVTRPQPALWRQKRSLSKSAFVQECGFMFGPNFRTPPFRPNGGRGPHLRGADFSSI